MVEVIKYNVEKDGTKIVSVGGGTYYNQGDNPTGGTTPTIKQLWQNSTGAGSLIPSDTSNKAEGGFSVAVGVATETSNDGELACGTYNQSTSGYTLFSVGDGDATDTRHNVFEASTTGISSTNGSFSGDVIITGTAQANHITSNTAQFSGTAQANHIIANSAKINGLLDANQLQSVSGYIQTLLSDSIVTDYLTVTKAAHFFKLIIDEIKATGGQVIITPANAILDKVSAITGGWRCYFKCKDKDGKQITNGFEVNDQVVCQTFNVATGVSYDVSNRYYWRKVTATGTTTTSIDGQTFDVHYFDLSASDCDLSSMTPSVGDECVQLGNRTDTTRQAAIIISAYNSEFLDKGLHAPSIVQYAGINDYNLSNHRLNVISNGLNQFKGAYTNNQGTDIEQIISTTANTLNGEISAVSGSVSTLSGSVGSLSTNVTTLSGTVTSHTQSISNLEQTDNQLSSRISANTTSIGTLSDNVNTLSGTVTSHTQSISNLEQTSSSLTSTVSAHTQSITTISGNVTTLSGDVQTQNGKINTLSGTVTSHTQSISQLQQTSSSLTSTVSANTQNITTISGSVSTVSGSVNTLSGSVNTVSGSVNSLSGDVQTQNGKINTLSGAVTSNTQSISQLQQTSSSLTSTVSAHTQSITTISGNVNSVSGDVVTIQNDYVTSSILNQTTSGISATVESDISGKLLSTGININDNMITMSSDNTQFVSASGSKTWLVGKSSNDVEIFRLGRDGNSSAELYIKNADNNYTRLKPNSIYVEKGLTSWGVSVEDGYPFMQMYNNSGERLALRYYNGQVQKQTGTATTWTAYDNMKVKLLTTSAGYTIEDDVDVVVNKYASSNVTVTLPSPSLHTGRKIYIKDKSDGAAIHLYGYMVRENATAASTQTMAINNIPVFVISDGEAWLVFLCS